MRKFLSTVSGRQGSLVTTEKGIVGIQQHVHQILNIHINHCICYHKRQNIVIPGVFEEHPARHRALGSPKWDSILSGFPPLASFSERLRGRSPQTGDQRIDTSVGQNTEGGKLC